MIHLFRCNVDLALDVFVAILLQEVDDSIEPAAFPADKKLPDFLIADSPHPPRIPTPYAACDVIRAERVNKLEQHHLLENRKAHVFSEALVDEVDQLVLIIQLQRVHV